MVCPPNVTAHHDLVMLLIAPFQQVAYGTASPWNLGLAYRIPDTNINLSAGHQQGRTNIQLSCVPDESAGMLGHNGFTRGVGPGNVRLENPNATKPYVARNLITG